jgi:glycosyltransferase involved in cell wall biosynthesis
MKLSILMPVYNERTVVERCISLVLAAPLLENMDRELVIVDDCSTDGTWDILTRLAGQHSEIRLFRQPKNQGKGAAVRAAIEHAAGDFSLVQDADLNTTPPNTRACCGPWWTATPTLSSDPATWPASKPASCCSGIP